MSLFENLPKRLRENLICQLDLKEISKLRILNKEWKKFIDSSDHPKINQLEQKRVQFQKNKFYNKIGVKERINFSKKIK